MRRAAKVAAAAVAAFGIVVIAQFPARWAAGALPRGLTCRQISGSVWNGACAGLAERGSPVGDLAWTAHPLRLLAGVLSADVALSRASATARARVDVGLTGSITAHGVHAALPLDRTLFPELPPSTHGSAQADLALIRWDGRRITAIRGQIEVRGLTDEQGEPIGDYRLSFPGSSSAGTSRPDSTSSEPVGRVTDLGGPFAVEGTVRLTPEPGYALDAQVAPRPGAPPDLVNALRFLGTPDASGRRPLSLVGTF